MGHRRFQDATGSSLAPANHSATAPIPRSVGQGREAGVLSGPKVPPVITTGPPLGDIEDRLADILPHRK